MKLVKTFEKDSLEENNERVYKKFFSRLFKDKRAIAKIVFWMFLASGVYVSIPFVLKGAVQKLYFIQEFHSILLIAFGLIVAGVIIGMVKEKLIINFSLKFVANTKKEVYKHVLKKSINKFQKTSAGEVLATLSYNLGLIKSLISDWGAVAIQQLINFTALFAASFFIDKRLAILFCLMLPIFCIYLMVIQYIVRQYALKLMTLNKKIFQNVDDHLTDFENIKVIAKEEEAEKSFNNLINKDLDVRVRRTLIYSYNKVILHGISLLLIITFIAIGGQYLNQQEMTFAEFVFFVLYIHLLFRPFEIALLMSSYFEAGKIGIKTVFPFISNKRLPRIKSVRLRGDIKIDNAKYTHKRSSFKLSKINLDIKSGDKVAIIGANNSGKSTFIQMILNLRSLQNGKMYFDGKISHDLGSRTIRKNIAVVSKDYLLSTGTIFNFLTSADKNKMKVFDSKLVELCQDLDLNRKIISIGSRKYQSKIKKNDLRLSTSEKIKFALVRAIYKNTNILLLDNVWRDLDSQNVQLIRSFLAKYALNKTIIETSTSHENLIIEPTKNYLLEGGKIIMNESI